VIPYSTFDTLKSVSFLVGNTIGVLLDKTTARQGEPVLIQIKPTIVYIKPDGNKGYYTPPNKFLTQELKAKITPVLSSHTVSLFCDAWKNEEHTVRHRMRERGAVYDILGDISIPMHSMTLSIKSPVYIIHRISIVRKNKNLSAISVLKSRTPFSSMTEGSQYTIVTRCSNSDDFKILAGYKVGLMRDLTANVRKSEDTLVTKFGGIQGRFVSYDTARKERLILPNGGQYITDPSEIPFLHAHIIDNREKLEVTPDMFNESVSSAKAKSTVDEAIINPLLFSDSPTKSRKKKPKEEDTDSFFPMLMSDNGVY